MYGTTAFSVLCPEATASYVKLHSWWWVEPEVAEGPESSTVEQLETAAPAPWVNLSLSQAATKYVNQLSIHLCYIMSSLSLNMYLNDAVCTSAHSFSHIKSHSIHPPAHVVSKPSNQAAGQILISFQLSFITSPLYPTPTSPKLSCNSSQHQAILQKGIRVVICGKRNVMRECWNMLIRFTSTSGICRGFILHHPNTNLN